MSPAAGSWPAGTPSSGSSRDSGAVFPTLLWSRKVSVSGSWAARSLAGALSSSRAVSRASPTRMRMAAITARAEAVDVLTLEVRYADRAQLACLVCLFEGQAHGLERPVNRLDGVLIGPDLGSELGRHEDLVSAQAAG